MRLTTDVAIKAVDKGTQIIVKQLFKKTRQKELLVLAEDLERLILTPAIAATA